MQIPVAVCENESCEKVIHKSDEVWHKGTEMYCSGKNVYFNRSDTLNKRFCPKNMLLEV